MSVIIWQFWHDTNTNMRALRLHRHQMYETRWYCSYNLRQSKWLNIIITCYVSDTEHIFNLKTEVSLLLYKYLGDLFRVGEAWRVRISVWWFWGSVKMLSIMPLWMDRYFIYLDIGFTGLLEHKQTRYV
jgi:hypothetical protein